MKKRAEPVLKFINKVRNFHLGDWCGEVYDKLEQAGITHWPVQASALGYYCILGLVPFLALCFAVARSFGLEESLSKAIDSFFIKFSDINKYVAKTAEEAASLDPAEVSEPNQVVDLIENLRANLDNIINNFFSNYSGGLMAFVALGLIFWSGYRILTLLEVSLGSIFGYQPPRRLIHRFMDYFTIMVIVPMVLVAGGSINIILAGLKDSWNLPNWLDPSALVSVFVIISPYLMWWLLFSWAFAYFSRGLIRWPERLLGGFITGLVFQVFQTFIIFIIFSLTSYNAIYTGFAFIPLFLIWIYTSWMIVLSGAELTRRLSDYFVTRRNLLNLVSPATWLNTVELSKQVLREIIKNYQSEPIGGPTSFRRLSRSTGAPLPALGAVINRLLAVDLVVRISGPTAEDGPTFLPARSPELMTDQYIIEALEKGFITVYN